ncbi:MAG: hypothetical protein U0359_40905 [Byssovorax sp.]
MFMPTSAIVYYLTLAVALFFVARPFLSLSTPKITMPLALAAVGPALIGVSLVGALYVLSMFGPGLYKYMVLGFNLLFLAGLALTALAVLGAAGLDPGTLFQRFPGPGALIAGGLGIGALHLVAAVASLNLLPGVVLTTATACATIAGLTLLVDQAYPVKNPGAASLGKLAVPPQGLLFFPGFIGFFATAFLLLAIFGPPDENPFSTKIADLICLDIVLVGWALLLRRHNPFLWILERRPEGVVWTFIKQTRVISRGAGSWTVWASNIGTDGGQILTQPTGSQGESEHLCVSVAQMCPGVQQGYTEQVRASFGRDPASLRRRFG